MRWGWNVGAEVPKIQSCFIRALMYVNVTPPSLVHLKGDDLKLYEMTWWKREEFGGFSTVLLPPPQTLTMFSSSYLEVGTCLLLLGNQWVRRGAVTWGKLLRLGLQPHLCPLCQWLWPFLHLQAQFLIAMTQLLGTSWRQVAANINMAKPKWTNGNHHFCIFKKTLNWRF